MRQVLRPGALGRPRGIGWGGRWEGGSGWGTHVTPWLIHVNVWQNPLQYCKVISLQLIKVNAKKNKKIKESTCNVGHLDLTSWLRWSLGQEDPLEEGMATHCSILAWRIPWRQEPGGLAAVHGIAELGTTKHSTVPLSCHFFFFL